MARQRKGDTGRVLVMMSDGEFHEGQVWEAVESMSFYKLDNMIVYVDVNGQCCDGKMEDVMDVEPLQSRLESFGARVFKVDAHDVDAMYEPSTLEPDGRPIFVLCYSNPTKGLDLMNTRAPKLHYLRFTGEEERETYRQEYQKMLAERAN